MAIIDKIQVSGVTYDIGGSGSSGNNVVEVTQEQYDALVSAGTVDLTAFYIITDAESADMSEVVARLGVDEEVTAAGLNALNDKFGGLKLVKLSQADYTALTTKDENTVYFIGDSNGYIMKIGNATVS